MSPKKSIIEIIRSNKRFPEILESILPEGEHVPMKQGGGKKPKMIPALAKDDVGFQMLLAHPDKKVRDLCKARQMAKSWPTHIKRINSMANQAIASGGLLRVPLNYYGAHTGRPSGGERINLLNLGGKGRGGQGTHPLISAMRNLLTAPDGKILGIVDSAQQEARILGWLAGQDDLVKEFAEGKSPYCTLATELFGEEVYKPSDEEKETPEGKVMAIKYGFGKDAILGCGYGMGTNTFFQRCRSNENLRPLFDSGEYDWDFIDKLIKTYRRTYSKIPAFWQSVEKAFKWVIKYPHEPAMVSGVRHKIYNETGYRILFFNDNGTVHIRLPSGRELTYRHSALKKTTRGSEIRWHWGHLWGGSITENIVQAVASDLLNYWVLEMEKQGLDVVLHCYDEVVCMFLEEDPFLEVMIEIMCSASDWADGLPLDAEGFLSRMYTK